MTGLVEINFIYEIVDSRWVEIWLYTTDSRYVVSLANSYLGDFCPREPY